MGTTTTKTETGLTCNTAYTRYAWAYSACGNSTPVTLTQTTSSSPPAAPTAGTHVPAATQIVWNWNTVSGATGYKWGTTDVYASATDMGTATTKTETGLTPGTAYSRYVWAYNTCFVSAATTLTQSTLAWSCGLSITDSRDSKVYTTVLIGSQCWMAQNLNIGTKINGNSEQTNNSIPEKYCYNDLESNCDIYGGLYQWNEWMNYTTSSNANPSERQGICLTGWHVPSDAEWCQMETYLDATVSCSAPNFRGTDIGGKIKEPGTSHWLTPNSGATNTSEFTCLPGGYRTTAGGFLNLTINSVHWGATESSSTEAWERDPYYNNAQVSRNYFSKFGGFSGRCIKD